MDVRPVGAARRVVRHATVTRAPDVSQLLPLGCPLAVHGASIGEQGMSAPLYSNLAPIDASGIIEDVLCGLTASRKTLPPKLFYDNEGARLFERMRTLDEYELTRSETSLPRASVDEIGEPVGARAALVEYGSGAGVKV